jgi:hypothetical protein
MTSDSLRWFTSSYSNNGGKCVEVARVGDGSGLVPVRDSKDPSGPALTFTAPAWTAFLTAVREGDFPTP